MSVAETFIYDDVVIEHGIEWQETASLEGGGGT